MTLSIDSLRLGAGSHDTRDDGLCVMEAVAWLAGEQHSDQPQCASPVIRAFAMGLNDAWDDEARQRLIPYTKLIVNTRDGLDDERALMAFDWLCRTHVPAWLDLADAGWVGRAALARLVLVVACGWVVVRPERRAALPLEVARAFLSLDVLDRVRELPPTPKARCASMLPTETHSPRSVDSIRSRSSCGAIIFFFRSISASEIFMGCLPAGIECLQECRFAIRNEGHHPGIAIDFDDELPLARVALDIGMRPFVQQSAFFQRHPRALELIARGARAFGHAVGKERFDFAPVASAGNAAGAIQGVGLKHPWACDVRNVQFFFKERRCQTFIGRDPIERDTRRGLETGRGAVAHLLAAFHVPVNVILRHAEIMFENAARPERALGLVRRVGHAS